LLGIESAFGLLDEGDHIAHIQDAIGHAIRMEDLEILEFLPDRGEEDRAPGHSPDGQGSSTASVTVEFREDHTIESDALSELAGRGHGILTDHRVDDEEDVVWFDSGDHPGELSHEFLIDGKTAGSIDDHDVVELLYRESPGIPCNVHWITDPVPRLRGVDGDPGLLTHDAQLVNRVGALQVRGYQEWRVTLATQMSTELASQGGLPRSLESRQHHHGGRGLRHAQRSSVTAQDLDELLVDDLDDLLRWIQCPQDFRPSRAFPDRIGEVAHHGEGDVGLEKCGSDLAHGDVDVLLSQAPLTPEASECGAQSIGEGGEHVFTVISEMPGCRAGVP
jgi:hypothetical protein